MGDPVVLNPHLLGLADRVLCRLVLHTAVAVRRLHRPGEGVLRDPAQDRPVANDVCREHGRHETTVWLTPQTEFARHLSADKLLATKIRYVYDGRKSKSA